VRRLVWTSFARRTLRNSAEARSLIAEKPFPVEKLKEGLANDVSAKRSNRMSLCTYFKDIVQGKFLLCDSKL